MTSGGVKERKRNLTSKEVDVLRLLYRFRFATNEHLAAAQGVHAHTVRLRAARLVEMGYVTRIRDGRARVEGRPGVYVLSSKGATFLKNLDSTKFNAKVLNNILNSKAATPDFIARNLSIFSIFNVLEKQYDDIIFLTKSSMRADRFDYLPEFKPDALIQIGESHFFLYLLESNSPDFAHIRRFKPIFDYATSGAWESATDTTFPQILFAAESKRLEKYVEKKFNNLTVTLGSDLKCVTTTLEMLAETRDCWLINDDRRSLDDLPV